MRAPVTQPHRPFDRLWQPGHPFRPRRSSGRRWCMGVLLVFLSSVIASYWALTDPVRLRVMVQTYLSDLVGGRVSVGSASLSLLQGLRLSDVKIRVDGSAAPDAVVFDARSIDIEYNPTALLQGRLVATRIVATSPHVMLVESADGRWNYQRLKGDRRAAATRPAAGPAGGVPLPQVVLRDAQVDYQELIGGRLVPRGSMDVGGRLFPSSDAARYRFELQSRGAIEGVGPVVTGQVELRGRSAGQVDATLAHFRFGRDIEAMLPRQVRTFWQDHQLQGAVDIPEFRYTPAVSAAGHGHVGRPATFRLRTRLEHVRLVVQPDELEPKGRSSTRPADPPPPIAVDDVTGEFAFDEAGVRFDGVRGTLLGNTVAVTGTLAGYSPDAPVHLHLETPPDRPLVLPTVLPYLSSLPAAVREAYGQVKPSGTGTLRVDVDRPTRTAPPTVVARLTILNGAFDCVFFPYPLRDATGVVTVGPDPLRGFERVDLTDVEGHGVAGGPNADGTIRLDGWVGPLNPEVGCGLRASGQSIAAEPPLFAALPPAVRRGLAVFQGTAGEPTPAFRGDFACRVDMPVGLGTKPVVTADLTLLDGAGRLAAFPYPVRGLHGDLHVRDGYVDLHDVALRQGQTWLAVNGRVSWNTGDGPDDVRPDLTVSARNVPLDATLLDVLPPAAGRFVHGAGATGLLDVDGRVTARPVPDGAPGVHPGLATNDPPVTYDLTVGLHDGTARPLGGDLTVTDVTADLAVRPDRVDVRRAHGRRGAGDLLAAGTVDLPADGPAVVRLNGTARGLRLDAPLRSVLPPSARAGWDALAPAGTVDADLTYAAAAAEGAPVDYRLTLRPQDVSVCPPAVPYRLDHVTGTVTVDPRTIALAHVHGTHGPASVALAGEGITDHPDRWNLTLSTRDLPVDADLRRALPAGVRAVVEQGKFHGRVDVDLTTLNYRGGTDAAVPGATPGATADVDLIGSARTAGASLDVGVPVDGVTGGVTFQAAVRGGHVAAFRGDLDLDALALAGRPLAHLRAHLDQPSGSDTLRLSDVRGELAGGRLAGRVDLRFPRQADGATPGATPGATTAPAGGYSVAFAVTDADVATIAGPAVPGGKPIRGRLSASLDMQGDWADPATRRGRGDVLVAGRDMYQIPVLLGLLEVTDLALPTSRPFSEASARYAVDGRRVTFEQLQMRGDDLVMAGSGWLDFGTRRVRMDFTTDNPHMAGLPVLHDLWQGAKRELLQIQVRGTVQDPQVSAASLHTFTTTVDEVLSGHGDDR